MQQDEAKLREKRKAFIAAAAVVAAVLVLITACTPPGARFWEQVCYSIGIGDWRQEQELLELHFLDVGKADAILIKSRGHAALLDAGNYVNATDISDYLSRYGVEELDYLIMSHPDKDHMGGMVQIMDELTVSAFVQSEVPEGLEPNNQEYRQLQHAIDTGQTERIVLSSGDRISLGAAELTAIGPVCEYDSANDISLVLRLTCGEFSALFCGDMESGPERDLIESGQDLHADLLKVGHHGSKTSSSEEFIRAVSPAWAVICVGPDRNHLPREEVLMRLDEAGVSVFRTDVDGTLRFIYDGERLRLHKER